MNNDTQRIAALVVRIQAAKEGITPVAAARTVRQNRSEKNKKGGAP